MASLSFDSIVDRSSIKCQMFIPFLDSQGVLTYLKLQDIICDDLTRLGVTQVVGGELGWCARQCWLTRVSMTARRAQPRTAVGEERGTGDHVLAPWMLRLACSRDE